MNDKYYKYDVIVAGGGLSGSAAACAASSSGLRTLLISINMDSLAAMQFGNYFTPDDIKSSLNRLEYHGSLIPNIIKKNILAEISGKEKTFEDLGGFWIIDRKRFALQIKEMLERQKDLETRQGLVAEVRDDERGLTVRTSDSLKIKAKAVIICSGTFLNARMYWGENIIKAGRPGEIFSSKLYKNLVGRGLKFKTGKLFSAPKILRNTINRNADNIQINKSGKAYLYAVSDISEIDQGWKGKKLFLIPEGMETEEMYVYGFENDLAEVDQIEMLENIKGLEKIYMTRPGYRIEYRCLSPNEIKKDMESKTTKKLFFAGKITGIDSYGGSLLQGFTSGINASRAIKGKELINKDDL
jgi:tRNA uridine 5-carboxymethylaminomethyl modification enzyme